MVQAFWIQDLGSKVWGSGSGVGVVEGVTV